MGWYDLSQGIGNEDAYLVAAGDKRISRFEKRIVAFHENDLPDDMDCGGKHDPLGCPPIITAPTYAKTFTYPEQHWIWRDVIGACSRVSSFVFLGYSLPTDDLLTRAAIRKAVEGRVKGRLRCLVVGRPLSDVEIDNYRSVFPGFDGSRNHLTWEFGSGGTGLGRTIRDRLERARV